MEPKKSPNSNKKDAQKLTVEKFDKNIVLDLDDQAKSDSEDFDKFE